MFLKKMIFAKIDPFFNCFNVCKASNNDLMQLITKVL